MIAVRIATEAVAITKKKDFMVFSVVLRRSILPPMETGGAHGR